MKIPRWIIVSGTAVLAVLMALILLTGFSMAQEPEPDADIDAAFIPEAVVGVIPIQGRLTDDNGSPIDGTRVITFSLYASSYAATPVCQDDDWVVIDNGLFNFEMDNCSSLDVDGKQLYLGIQVEGDDEMTPREPIFPVPYAYSLRPGAVISGTTSVAIVHIENHHASGRGLRAYAMSETGANYGIVGASRSPDGYGGYYYNNGGGTGLLGKITDAPGGIGVKGLSTGGSGVYGDTDSGYGVYGSTDAASHNYGLFTPDNIYSLNYSLMGATMQVVQNAGSETLELGDVVAFSGISEPLEDGGSPVIQIVGSTDANSTAVAGVVFSRFNIEAVTENMDPAQIAPGGEFTPAGLVAPGEYMLMVIQGPAQVKASAPASKIQPGDLLSSASETGYAGKAAEVNFNGVSAPAPGTILGKALETLKSDKALIYIFITLQ